MQKLRLVRVISWDFACVTKIKCFKVQVKVVSLWIWQDLEFHINTCDAIWNLIYEKVLNAID
jgi:hypothetical protein